MESKSTLLGIALGLVFAYAMAMLAPPWIGIAVGAVLIISAAVAWVVYMIALAIQSADNDEDMP